MLTEVAVDKGCHERRFGERRRGQGSAGLALSSFERVSMEREDAFVQRQGIETHGDGGRHCRVAFWTADGSRQEGSTSQLGGSMMFIESDKRVPVGSEITVELAQGDGGSNRRELVDGVVAWHCPFADEFQHGEGFAVRLHSSWPQGPWPIDMPRSLGRRGGGEDDARNSQENGPSRRTNRASLVEKVLNEPIETS